MLCSLFHRWLGFCFIIIIIVALHTPFSFALIIAFPVTSIIIPVLVLLFVSPLHSITHGSPQQSQRKLPPLQPR